LPKITKDYSTRYDTEEVMIIPDDGEYYQPSLPLSLSIVKYYYSILTELWPLKSSFSALLQRNKFHPISQRLARKQF